MLRSTLYSSSIAAAAYGSVPIKASKIPTLAKDKQSRNQQLGTGDRPTTSMFTGHTSILKNEGKASRIKNFYKTGGLKHHNITIFD